MVAVAAVRAPPAASGISQLLARQIQHVDTAPDKVLELVSARAVVGQEAALVAAHRQVVDQEGAGRGLIRTGVEGAVERLEEACDILAEITHLPRGRPDQFGLIRRQMRQVLGPFGMLDLLTVDLDFLTPACLGTVR